MKNPLSRLAALALLFLALSVVARARPGANELRPYDMIDVKVFQEDDLQSTLRISGDGTVNFPLIGTVSVAYKSPQQAADTISQALARGFLVNPQVSVTVKEYAKRRFTVLGEVQKPGAYDMPDRDPVNLLEAIAMAGGYTRIAEPGQVLLKRFINGRETVFKLNAKVMAKKQGRLLFEVRPNDVITVSESLF